MNKRVIQIIFLCCINFNANSQQIIKQIRFTFDTSNFNICPDSILAKTVIDGKYLKVNTINTLTHKETAEFLRISDNTYYYVQKNDSNKVIAEGKGVLQKIPNKKIKINTYNTKGYINGFIYYQDYKFTKESYWYEKITDTTALHGKYLNNKKNGRWVFSTTPHSGFGFNTKEIFYKNDTIIKENNLQILTKSKKEIESALLGYWEVVYYNSSDTILAFNKTNTKTYSYGKINLTFFKNGECKINGRSQHRSSSQIYKWKIENNSIRIKADEKTVFVIDNMNKGYLILKLII